MKEAKVLTASPQDYHVCWSAYQTDIEMKNRWKINTVNYVIKWTAIAGGVCWVALAAKYLNLLALVGVRQ